MKQGMKQSVKRGMECDHRCSLVGHEVEQAEGCLPTARPMAAVQRRVEAPEPPHTARTPCTGTMHRHHAQTPCTDTHTQTRTPHTHNVNLLHKVGFF